MWSNNDGMDPNFRVYPDKKDNKTKSKLWDEINALRVDISCLKQQNAELKEVVEKANTFLSRHKSGCTCRGNWLEPPFCARCNLTRALEKLEQR